MYVKPNDFIGNQLLYLIDTAHPNNTSNSENNIIINTVFQNSLILPPDTNIRVTVYIVIVSEKYQSMIKLEIILKKIENHIKLLNILDFIFIFL